MTAALATHDPAVAIAMARCLTARTLDPAHRSVRGHERECGWCPWPSDELRIAVDEFNAWAAYDDRLRATGRHATRIWAELPRPEQLARIAAAQALGNDLWASPPPEPEPAVPAPPPDVEEEVPSWLK